MKVLDMFKKFIPISIRDFLRRYVDAAIRFFRIVFYGDEVEVAFFNFETSERLRPVPGWNRFRIFVVSLRNAMWQLKRTYSETLREEMVVLPDPVSFSVMGDYAKYNVEGTFKNGLSLDCNVQGTFEIPPPFSNIASITLFAGRQRLSSEKGHLHLQLRQGNETHLVLKKNVNALENHWDLYRFQLPSSLRETLPVTLECEADSVRSRVCVSSPLISRKKDDRTILIFILDAVRPNDVGLYNPKATNTPEIDSFFREGIFYRNSFAQSNWTLPCFASMALSHYASRHNVVDSNRYSQPMSREVQTLAELMREEGFFTYGSFSHVRCNYALGHHRGFEHFRSGQTVRAKFGTAGEKGFVDLYSQLRELKNYLKNFEGSPFFGFTHLSDTHYPYFHNPGKINDHHLLCSKPVNRYVLMSKSRKYQLHPDERALLEESYKRKLREVDAELGEIFGLLQKREHVTVILASDHGYSFLHPRSQDLSDELVRTPFLITSREMKLKGNGQRVIESSVDLLPTLTTLYRLKDKHERCGESIFSAEGVELEKSCGITELVYDDGYQLKWIDSTRSSMLFEGRRDRKSGVIDLMSLKLLKRECEGISEELLSERTLKGIARSKLEPRLKDRLLEILI